VVRIVVVDNASNDGTLALVERLASDERRITLVRNSDNRGFAAACNQGASALDTPWVAFVNPDCYIQPEALQRLVAHGLARAGAGMLGVDLVDENGRADPAARRRDPSLRELLKEHGRRDDLYLGRDPKADVQEVEAISGALMLVPLGLFLQLGGFDEAFRLHVEDLDLCRRTRAAGYEVLVANDITAVHVGGVSGRNRPLWVEWQKHGSLWRYFKKFEADETPWWLKPVLWAGLWAHFVSSAARALLRPR
jgi:GT2 family glycosyltransferase